MSEKSNRSYQKTQNQKRSNKRKSGCHINSTIHTKSTDAMVWSSGKNAVYSLVYKSYMKRGEAERRARGRPRVRWIDNIKETLHEHQMTLSEAARKARTRTLYLPRHP